MYACMHACMHACICMYVCIYVCTYICFCVCAHNIHIYIERECVCVKGVHGRPDCRQFNQATWVLRFRVCRLSQNLNPDNSSNNNNNSYCYYNSYATTTTTRFLLPVFCLQTPNPKILNPKP